MEFDYSLQPGRELNNTNELGKNIKPLVSIVTAYYNAGKYFRQTFNSVMNQTFPWFEWIIVNDGSTDEKDIELLNKMAATDSRIIIINQKNGGLSCARNVGIKHSNTEIIIPLDADDLIAPPYVEYLFWGLYYNPDAAWCYTHSVGFHAEEYLWKFPWDTQKLKTYNFLTATAAIRKKDIEEIGGYKIEKWPYFEDWRFWLEMLEKHKKPVCLGGYLFWYRRLKKGMLSTIRENPEQEMFANNIIETAARNVDITIKAKEYPLMKTEHLYYEPKVTDIGNEYITTNKNMHILMLLPCLEQEKTEEIYLDFVKYIDKLKFDVSIFTTIKSENEWQQKFELYTNNIFNLPDFLDPAYYLDFMSYYIKAKSVGVIMVANSHKGYYMIPWIRKNFPKISIIDYVYITESYWKVDSIERLSRVMRSFLDKSYVYNNMMENVMVEQFNQNEDNKKVFHIGIDTKIVGTASAKMVVHDIEKEIMSIVENNKTFKWHEEMQQTLQKQGKYAEEFYISRIALEEREQELKAKRNIENQTISSDKERELLKRLAECEEVVNRHEEVVNRHEEVVNRHEEVVNRHEEVVNRHEKVVNRHEEVVNRHEEVVNRHEEVINRHEEVVNHDWIWLTEHESRINEIYEQNRINNNSIFKRVRENFLKRVARR